MSETSTSPQAPGSFHERMDVLTQELELSLRWNRPCLFWVAYSSEYVRADSASQLENSLLDREYKVVWIHASDASVNSLAFWQNSLTEAGKVVFFIDGLNDLPAQRGFQSILQQHAYLFTERRAHLVLWLTHNEAAALAYLAPALWTGRQRLIELTAAPKPEQILQSALESAWQGTGETNDHFEDTEAKISLRESFLTDLPKNNESTAMRANLLLTLGVLHWRRSDYERASEMLQNALHIAAKLQDSWFEAECFNALALVKASLGKHEEAIDAYKQAIQLAPGQIFAWNNLGNLCLKIDRPHEAMIAFQKAIEHNATDPVAWNGMGDVYSRSEYTDDAIAAYRKSIELAPGLPHPWNGLGEVYARSGRPNEAVLAFQKAIHLNGHFVLPWLGMARLYAKQERYRDAIRAFGQALSLDPHNSSLWNELGSVHIKAARYEDAIEAFARAIELDRGFGWAYSNLALAHASAERVAESIPLYLKSLDLLRDLEQRNITWNRLANAYRLLNDYDKAIHAYQMADSPQTTAQALMTPASDSPEPAPIPEAAPAPETEAASLEVCSVASPMEDITPAPESQPETDAPVWLHHVSEPVEEHPLPFLQTSSYLFGAELQQTQTQPATATQEIGGLSMQMTVPFLTTTPPALKLAPKVDTVDARMWNEKGNLLFRAGAVDDAIKAYNKAIKADRGFGWAYCNLGIAYLHLRKFAEAVLLLQKSLELLQTAREQAVAWNELGNLYRCLNDYHNAAEAYRRADELDPEHAGVRDTVEYLHAEPNAGNAQVWNQLGDSFFKASAYPEAADCYRKAAELEPHNGGSFSNLALCLTLQSKFEEAVLVYLRSIELFQKDTDKADAWNRLGNVYRRLNDYDNAIAAYQQAVKLNHTNAPLLTRARFSLLGNCNVD